jgi:hypothetical protein
LLPELSEIVEPFPETALARRRGSLGTGVKEREDGADGTLTTLRK